MKNRLHLTISILFLTIGTIMANGLTTQTIRGTVVDAITGYPLIGASVVLLNVEPIMGTTTDLNGLFEIKNVPLGRQSVKITYMGYKPQFVNNILVTSGKEIQINIKLDEDISELTEVVVKGETAREKALNPMATVSALTFSVEETERFAGSLGDPARMVSNYAGVATSNDSRNDIIIRGNSPMGVLWRLEGIEIANPNHFGASGTTGGPVSMINNNLLTNSDFFTSAFPSEYGNALSGVFDLNLRSGNPDKHEYVGQVGFNGFEFGAEGPMFTTRNGQKATFLANYRYSTLGFMKDIGFAGGTGTAIPEYQDLTFMVDIPGTKAGRFKVFGLWGKSYIELGREYLADEENLYNNHGTATDFGAGLGMAGLSHTYFFNENIRLVTNLSYQTTYNNTVHDSVRNQGAEIMPFVRSNNSENKFSASTHLKYKMDTKNNFSAGIIVNYLKMDWVDSINLYEYGKFVDVYNIDGTTTLLKSYAQWQHHFSNKLTTYAGLHGQYLILNKSVAVEPRLGLNYMLNPQHSFNVGVGLHSQSQPISTYFYQTYDSTTQTYSKTNTNLDFTRSLHLVLGYNYNITPTMRLKAETYYQDLNSAPVAESFPEFSLLNTGANFGLEVEDSLVNNGTGSNYGVELTFEKFLNRGFYVLVTTSLFNSTYKGYDSKTRNTAFNNNYIVNALTGYEYKLSEKFMLTFDLRTTWSGGKRYVPIDEELSRQNHKTEYDWSKAYEKRYDDYFRTDLRIGFKQNGKRFSQEWGIDLQNVTNYQSVFSEAYDADKDEVYQTYQQGFMPMFLYRIQF